MAYSRRIQKDLENLKEENLAFVKEIKIDETNMLQWEVVVSPSCSPYNKGNFRIQLDFPDQYPFKPPVIIFKTKIYHPNVDGNGNVCLSTINSENWKPVTRISKVITDLVDLINHPQPEHPLRTDIAQEFMREKKKFMKNAEEFTKRYSEKQK